jgi:hypothetical protein
VSEGRVNTGNDRSAFHQRRLLRLQREVKILEGMNEILWIKAVKCAGVIVCGLFAIFSLCAAKLNWFGFTPVEAFSLSALVAFGCWWFARYSKNLGLTLGFLALAIIFEDASLDGISRDNLTNAIKPSKSELRRLKAANALKKRRILLTMMAEHS